MCGGMSHHFQHNGAFFQRPLLGKLDRLFDGKGVHSIHPHARHIVSCALTSTTHCMHGITPAKLAWACLTACMFVSLTTWAIACWQAHGQLHAGYHMVNCMLGIAWSTACWVSHDLLHAGYHMVYCVLWPMRREMQFTTSAGLLMFCYDAM